MKHLTGYAAEEILQALDDRLAIRIDGASTVAGADREYRIDCYAIGQRVVRCEYNTQSTRHRFEEYSGTDLAEFKHYYHIN